MNENAESEPSSGKADSASGDDAPSLLNSYIQELQAGQDDAKTSIENRGALVITSAGGIATLLFGLVSFIEAQKNYSVPNWAGRALFVGVALMGAAAITAVWTNKPRDYETAKEEGMRTAVREHWDDPPETMLRRIAVTRLDLYYQGLKQNNAKAGLLRKAIFLEALGAAFLSLSAACVIANW